MRQPPVETVQPHKPLRCKRHAAAADVELGEGGVASAQRFEQDGSAFFSDRVPLQIQAAKRRVESEERREI